MATDYFFVITIRALEHGYLTTATRSGVLNADGPSTAMQRFNAAVEHACDGTGFTPENVVVEFYHIEKM